MRTSKKEPTVLFVPWGVMLTLICHTPPLEFDKYSEWGVFEGSVSYSSLHKYTDRALDIFFSSYRFRGSIVPGGRVINAATNDRFIQHASISATYVGGPISFDDLVDIIRNVADMDCGYNITEVRDAIRDDDAFLHARDKAVARYTRGLMQSLDELDRLHDFLTDELMPCYYVHRVY